MLKIALYIIGLENKAPRPAHEESRHLFYCIAAIAVVAYIVFKVITGKRNKEW
jgi:hypothetical protein